MGSELRLEIKFLINIFLQPDDVNDKYFILWLLYSTEYCILNQTSVIDKECEKHED